MSEQLTLRTAVLLDCQPKSVDDATAVSMGWLLRVKQIAEKLPHEGEHPERCFAHKRGLDHEDEKFVAHYRCGCTHGPVPGRWDTR